MFGSEFLVPPDDPAPEIATPLWVHIALWVPFLNLIAWGLTNEWVRTNPPSSLQPVAAFLSVSMLVTFTLGFGSVLASCLYYLIRAMLTGRSRLPKP